jgi:hypothetical protein
VTTTYFCRTYRHNTPTICGQKHTTAYGQFGEKVLGFARLDQVRTASAPGSQLAPLSHTPRRRSQDDSREGRPDICYLAWSPHWPRVTFVISSPMMVGVTSELALPTAWVVKCKKCGCTVNCRAIDARVRHAEPEKAEPAPQDTLVLTCSCCWAAYRYKPAEVFKGPRGTSASRQANRSVNHADNNKDARETDSVLLIRRTDRRRATQSRGDKVISRGL